MSRTRGKKISFFRRGASAIQQYLGTDEFYVCPLCMGGFSEAAVDTGELTIEHVPPKALGGQGLLLTCKRCNNSSGHSLDAALSAREEQRQFAELVLGKESGYRGPAKWTAGGETLNVEVYRDGKFVTIAGVPERNNPSVTERISQISSLSGRLTSRIRYHRRRAQIGDLRTAYLASVALLGYRYAFHAAFNPIREQIAQVDTKVMDGWSITLDPETPIVRNIFEFSTPFPCVVVQINRIAVLLPIPAVCDDLYERLARTYGTDRRIQLGGGDLVGWPTSLELREDFLENSLLPPPVLTIQKDN